MTTQIKYLLFRGVEKKEQILFRSFLNLVKNDIDYEIEIMRTAELSERAPDFMIMDEEYEFSEEECTLVDLPTITIGKYIESPQDCYIVRPVQWSDFKLALEQLNLSLSAETEPERVLPDEVDLEIAEEPEPEPSSEQAAQTPEAVEADDYDYDYEFELDNMSSDYHSFTNSDYVKVASDVQGFKEGEIPEQTEPVILMTDDESASVNSVLILETNSFDAWDYSETQIAVSDFEEPSESSFTIDSFNKVEKKQPIRKGLELDPDEEYWHEDNEIIVDQQTFLFVKAKRKMVYSTKPPCDWPAILQRRGLSKLPLHPEWRPTNGLAAYPLSSLIWVNTLINETSALTDGLNENTEYMLDHWPAFNLLELDNILLKLCTMLFVRPESISSLASKSGYGRSTIIGLMNACYQMGLLVTPDKIDSSKLTKPASDEGMLGRIRDVFR